MIPGLQLFHITQQCKVWFLNFNISTQNILEKQNKVSTIVRTLTSMPLKEILWGWGCSVGRTEDKEDTGICYRISKEI